MKTVNFKLKKTLITFSLYWSLLSINVLISKSFEFSTMVEWWMNTIVFLVFMLIFILTSGSNRSLFIKLLFVPISWLIHAVLTIPSAFVLGILMYDQNQIRSMGEHRAVFILASIPIIYFGMSRSNLFLNKKSVI